MRLSILNQKSYARSHRILQLSINRVESDRLRLGGDRRCPVVASPPSELSIEARYALRARLLAEAETLRSIPRGAEML
jgi:hypothetical protein